MEEKSVKRHEVPCWWLPSSLHRDNKARLQDCHAAPVNVMWGLLARNKYHQQPRELLAADRIQQPELSCRCF